MPTKRIPPSEKVSKSGRKPGVTSREIAERDRMICEMRFRGVGVERTAQTFGVSKETVKAVTRNFRATNPTMRTQDPIAIVDDMLLGYQADLEELATIGAMAKTENGRIGAINSRMVARDRIISLLQSTGVLPRDLGKLRVEIDVRYTAQTMVTILNKYSVPEVVQRELLSALRGDAPVAAIPETIEG